MAARPPDHERHRQEPLAAGGRAHAPFPTSGEINRRVADAQATIAAVLAKYEPRRRVDHTDGVSVEFDAGASTCAASNTEPLIRLNVESRGDEALMREKTAELLALIGGSPAD